MDETAELRRRILQLEARVAQLEQQAGAQAFAAAVDTELSEPSGAMSHMPRITPPPLPRAAQRPAVRPEAPPSSPDPALAQRDSERDSADMPSPPDSNYLSELLERRRESYAPRAHEPSPARAAGGPSAPTETGAAGATAAPSDAAAYEWPAAPPRPAAPPLVATSQSGAALPPPLPYQPHRPPPAPLAQRPLEQTIGLQWAGWIGALVVVIGAALGVKYAYDAGWIGKVPPELRLLLMALGGGALIAAGELVYRKVNRVSAAALFGAGVATLFLVSYSGYGFLEVYSREVAFGLMAVTTLIGAAVAVRGKLVSIAVLALLGGQLAPAILGGRVESLLPLLSYLLMLQVVAVSLAWWGGTTRWWTLRWLSLVLTGLWMLVLLADGEYRTQTIVFTFVLIYSGVFMGELLFSAVRPRHTIGAADLGAGVAFSLFVTAGLVIATLVALEDASKSLRGGCLVIYALLYAAAGFLIAGAPAGLMLSVALRTLAAALVVIAVPVALSGSAVVLVWAGMAVAFGVVGARLNLLISRVASLCTWAAAVIYLVIAVNAREIAPAPGDIAATVAEVNVPVYVVLAWLISLAGLAVAWLLATPLRGGFGTPAPAVTAAERSEGERGAEPPQLAIEPVVAEAVSEPGWSLAAGPQELLPGARALAAVATAVMVIATLHGLPPGAATIALVIWAWLLVALDLAAARLALAAQAMALLIFTAVKWAAVDLLARRLGEGWTGAQLAQAPVLNPMMALGALIAASLVAAYLLRRSNVERTLDQLGARADTRSAGLSLAGALVVLVTFALSMEIDRIVERWRGAWALSLGPWQVRLLAWTMLWCASASAVAALALRLESDLLARRRLFSVIAVIPLLLTVKFLTVDTTLWHLEAGRVRGTVLLNLEFLAAAFVLATILLYLLPLRGPAVAVEGGGASAGWRRSPMAVPLGLAALLVLLLVGQWEIGRIMNHLAVSPLARGVSISIWWSLFAIATVVAGFITRVAGLRYFGLTLFAITLAKVLILDTQTLDRGWRTVSFIALGLLLLGTSVVYGKYSPRLLGRQERGPEGGS